NHHHSVQTEGNSAMRRGSVLQRFEEKPKLFAGFILAEAQTFEYPRLYVVPMDSDGSAADFSPIQDKIVRFGAHAFRRALQQVEIFIDGSGERMMAGNPAVLIGIELEQRKVDDPEHVPLALWNPFLTPREFKSDGAHELTHAVALTAH